MVANRVRATIFASCGQHLPMTVVARIENARGHEGLTFSGEQPALDHNFAKQLATMLDETRCAGSFDQLILIAEPKLLGSLREQLSEPTRRLVKVESSQELSRPTQESLRSHLTGYARV